MAYLCLPDDVSYLMLVVRGAVLVSSDCIQIGLVECVVEIAVELAVGHVHGRNAVNDNVRAPRCC